jgi:uncharacterized membrane protein
VILLGILVMIPWAIYLSINLPVHYSAHNWDVAWVGFDTALIGVLAAAAWAAWNRRQILAATSIIAATMLLCDAWFDVSTSMGTKDQWMAVLSTLFVNLPLVIFFIMLARRIMLRTAAVLAAALSTDFVPHHAHDVAIPFATTWREQVIDHRSSQDSHEASREVANPSD